MAAIAMLKAYLDNWTGREEGQGMVEYVMIIGAISIVLVAAFITTDLTGAVGALVTHLKDAITPDAPAAGA